MKEYDVYIITGITIHYFCDSQHLKLTFMLKLLI